MENTHRMAARSAWKGSRRSLALAIAWTFLLPGVALALTVTGTVNDSSGNPIPSIRVQVWDEDTNDVIPTGDDLIDTVYTNAAGVYTMNAASGWGPENPDIYVVVDWKFPLTPAASFNNAHMNLIGTTTINTCGADAPILFTSKTSAITTDFAGASLTVPVQNMANALAQGVGNLHLAINRVINYYEDNKGSAGWSLSADVDVKVRLNPPTNPVGSFYCQNNGTIFIADVDINGGGGGFVSDIYHEMGHLLHHRMQGGPLPSGGFSGSHSSNTESDPEFALREAWPSYPAELTDGLYGNDNKYAVYRDTSNNGWRGDEASPTGRDVGGFESGERVEAAVGGVWFGLDSDPAFGLTTNGHNFDDILQVFLDDKPNHIFAFAQGLVADVGANTAAARQVYHHLQRHGIVFTRARFGPDPFALPQSGFNGSAQDVGGRVFLRGVVQTKVEATSTADLGVDQTIGLNRIRIRYNTPADNLTGTPASFPPANVTSWGVTPGGVIGFDTTNLTDGEYDLLIAGENVDGFEDNFLPTWAPNPAAVPADPGDANPTVDTEEKYLKVLGAWYDRDRNPNTNTGPEGKVVVDNTKPTTQVGVTP